MNPKKHKIIIEDFLRDTELDHDMVKDIVDFYWSNVRKAIIGVAYPSINIDGLGVFRIKPKSLDRTIEMYKCTIDKIDRYSFSKQTKYTTLKNRLEILENAKSIIIDEKERKKEIKTKRYGDNSRGVEEKGENT